MSVSERFLLRVLLTGIPSSGAVGIGLGWDAFFNDNHPLSIKAILLTQEIFGGCEFLFESVDPDKKNQGYTAEKAYHSHLGVPSLDDLRGFSKFDYGWRSILQDRDILNRCLENPGRFVNLKWDNFSKSWKLGDRRNLKIVENLEVSNPTNRFFRAENWDDLKTKPGTVYKKLRELEGNEFELATDISRDYMSLASFYKNAYLKGKLGKKGVEPFFEIYPQNYSSVTSIAYLLHDKCFNLLSSSSEDFDKYWHEKLVRTTKGKGVFVDSDFNSKDYLGDKYIHLRRWCRKPSKIQDVAHIIHGTIPDNRYNTCIKSGQTLTSDVDFLEKWIYYTTSGCMISVKED